MLERMIPDKAQEESINALLHNDSNGALIGSEVGAGKTLITVEFAIRSNRRRIVVVCPLGTRIGWTRTFERQGSDLPIYRIDTTKAAKEALARYVAGEEGVFLIGHSMFRRKVAIWEDHRIRVPDLAVYDEIQDASNPESGKVGWKVLKKFRADYRIAISGTWFGNKFERAWTGPRWVWWDYEGKGTHATGNRHVDTSWHRWKAEWCKREYDPFTWDKKRVVGEKNPGAWNAYLPMYIRTSADLDVKAITEEIFVELSRSQRKVYNDLEADGLTWLLDNPLVTDLPITTRIRLRQVTLGDLSFDGDGSITFAPDCKSAKYDALKEFLDNNPDDAVLIYTDSRKFAEVVAARLGEKAALWTGGTSQADRERLIDSFGREDGPQYLVAVIAALGAGVDGLQEKCHTLVWLSETEDNNLNHQALGRVLRRGQKYNVRNVYIKAVDTLDEGIYSRNLATELANRASLRKGDVAA